MKKFKNKLKVWLFKIWFSFHKIPPFHHKYYVAVCAIFKNEANNFKEWIEYNRIIGIEHFYLYNNNSTDNYLEVLEPYIKEGLVTLIDWPQNGAQALAYNHCLLNYRHKTYWLAYIDIDEFICPIYEWSFKDWLKKHERFPGIFINWLVFGSSGKINGLPDKLVMENYTQCFPYLQNTGKSIVNTLYDWDYGIHYMPLNLGRWGKFDFALNECGQIMMDLSNDRLDVAQPTIQLNHYMSKSYNDFLVKMMKGNVSIDVSLYPEYQLKFDYFWNVEKYCNTKDFKILKYATRLKKALKNGQD